jgi:hypothetical protein
MGGWVEKDALRSASNVGLGVTVLGYARFHNRHEAWICRDRPIRARIRAMRNSQMRGLLLGLCLLAAAAEARAYDVEVHRLLTVQSFLERAQWLSVPIAAPAEDDLSAFRRHLYALFADLPDDSLRGRFLERYPAEETFDAWALKELLALHGGAEVTGIDRPPSATTIEQLLADGAAQPDTDERNVGRVAYELHAGRRTPMRDRYGRPVPFDPSLLNMGRLGDVSSQAHAHYGLARVELSSDPDVLKKDPRRFAVAAGFPPGPVLALAPEMAQMHTDLAILAALSGLPSAGELGWLFGAQSWHYTQDVANQIHTVQVGIYDFFVAAQLRYWERAAKTLGGLTGELRPMTSIGIDIVHNHHALCEALTRKRVLALQRGEPGPPELRVLFDTLRHDDRRLAEAFDEAGLEPDGPFARQITEALVEASSLEGPEVYRLTHALADGRLSSYGARFRDTDDPDAALRPAAEESDEARRFYGLQAAGLRRAATAMRRWRALYLQALDLGRGQPEVQTAAAMRLAQRQLDWMDEAEARRARYLAETPPPAEDGVRDFQFIGAAAAMLLGALLVLAGLRRRRRRRRWRDD